MKLVLEKGQNIFFFSDPHYNHNNICSATTNWVNAEDMTRNFESLEHMNDILVNNINEVVGEDDIVFCLGDWSFGGFDKIVEFRSRIVCKNVHLVLGNHDEHIERNKDNIRRLFSSVNHYVNLDLRRPSTKNKGMVDKYKLILCHFPIASWDGMERGSMHLHGHTHLPENIKLSAGRAMDVGMDGNNMQVYSLDDILSLLRNQPHKSLCLPSDHHQREL
jgi:calcineurin-like phosphoesterase family protein